MTQQKMLKIVNPLLFIFFVFQMISGITGFMGEWHEFVGYLLTGLVLAHLYLNRAWIKASFLKRKK